MCKCSKCNSNKKIVNKFFKLCIKCNTERLKKDKVKGKLTFVTNIQKKPKNINLILDEKFYEKCFNSCKKHECEECGTKLPSIFRNSENKIVARHRYSHIVPKSIAPHLRRVIKNINHLCLSCHSKWENGDKNSMLIYSVNKKRFPNHFLD